MSNVLFVVLLENAFVLFSCLQHWQSLLDRHGLHSPEFLIGLMTLLFEILLLPIMSLRFLHRRYATIGRSLNLYSNLYIYSERAIKDVGCRIGEYPPAGCTV